MTVIAKLANAAIHIAFECPAKVTADVEVEETITVKIEERSAGGKSASGDASRRRDFTEFPVTIVMVEFVAAVVSDKQIRMAIVIVVADGNAHTVAMPP